MSSMTETVIDFIRHGKPLGNSTYRGHGIDDPLSETGWQQMWAAVGESCPWSQLVTSPLQRCRAFAQALAERHALPLAVDERFQEVGFGSWEGRTREEIQASNPGEYEAFYRDPVHCRPAGAEPLDEFFARVAEAYEELAKRYSGQHLLVVAHAGVIRAALAHVLTAAPAAAYAIKVDNAGLTRFRHSGSVSQLVFHNRRVL